MSIIHLCQGLLYLLCIMCINIFILFVCPLNFFFFNIPLKKLHCVPTSRFEPFLGMEESLQHSLIE